jgi:replicative DNA helicase
MNSVDNNFNKVKNAINLKEYARAMLKPARAKRAGKIAYICPNCNSGGHNSSDSDSALYVFTGTTGEEKFYCHSCGIKGDIFDLIGILNNTKNKREQLEIAAKYANIQLDYHSPSIKTDNTTNTTITLNPNPTPNPVKEKISSSEIEQNKVEEMKRLLIWQDNLPKSEKAVDYLKSRGYTLEQAKQLHIGYNQQNQTLVLPFTGSSYYHIDRNINPASRGKYYKPSTDVLGAQPLYNPAALKQDVCIIVEGVFDAIALSTLGFNNVIALCGAVNTTELIENLKGTGTGHKPYIIIFFDNDKGGTDGAKRLKYILETMQIDSKTVTSQDLAAAGLQGKDTDDMRRYNADALKSFLTDFCNKCYAEVKEQKEKVYKRKLQKIGVVTGQYHLMQVCDNNYQQKRVKTGFNLLDKVLFGGLPVGLTVIGALSSLGKTTLCLQIADYMAADGRPVLFVNIEQTSLELTTKSLSRISYIQPKCCNLTGYDTLTRPRTEFSQQQWVSLIAATSEYNKTISRKMYFMQGQDQPTVNNIAVAAQAIMQHEHTAPVVFVDYLQLLASDNVKATDKQNTDNNVSMLRKLASKLNTPIVLISSLNRASYNSQIAIDSFKESGGIEYSADVLLGLQPAGLSDVNATNKDTQRKETQDKIKEHKTSSKRETEIVVLKNRNGIIPANNLRFDFLPAYNYWQEVKVEPQKHYQQQYQEKEKKEKKAII